MNKAKLFLAKALPTAASLVLAQSSLLLLWLAMGAIPATAQTEQKAPDVCTSGHEAASSDCALTWHGITAYGAYDVGGAWVSHGMPTSPYNYEGESLVNRNGSTSRFLVAPNNLSQTGFGVRGKIQIAHDWYAVFNASTGINPQSGQLANASRTQIDDNGLDRGAYSQAIDGARAGQPFNDEYYGGVSSEKFGTLTFGRAALSRHRCDAAIRSSQRQLCLFLYRI